MRAQSGTPFLAVIDGCRRALPFRLALVAALSSTGVGIASCHAAPTLPDSAAAVEPRDSSEAEAGTPVSARRRFWIPAAEEGPLWRSDRLQHFSLSATLVLGASAAGARDSETAAAALSLGMVKEWIDARHGRGASRGDLLADVLGTAAGLLAWRLAH